MVNVTVRLRAACPNDHPSYMNTNERRELLACLAQAKNHLPDYIGVGFGILPATRRQSCRLPYEGLALWIKESVAPIEFELRLVKVAMKRAISDFPVLTT